MDELLKPEKEAIFYENDSLYACLASFPLSKGHSIVVWKKPIADLHLLSKEEYEYLMDKVDQVRNTLMKVLKVDKVYLMYMDEIKHVHWHLIPRYSLMGFNLLKHNPGRLKSFVLVKEIRDILTQLKDI